MRFVIGAIRQCDPDHATVVFYGTDHDAPTGFAVGIDPYNPVLVLESIKKF
jgi:hypothetical protein